MFVGNCFLCILRQKYDFAGLFSLFWIKQMQYSVNFVYIYYYKTVKLLKMLRNTEIVTVDSSFRW